MKPGPANARYLRQNEAPAGTTMLRCTSGRLLVARARRQPGSAAGGLGVEPGPFISEVVVEPQGGSPIVRAVGDSVVQGIVPRSMAADRERETDPQVTDEGIAAGGLVGDHFRIGV